MNTTGRPITRTYIRRQAGPRPMDSIESWDAATADRAKIYFQDARWAAPYIEWILDLYTPSAPWVHYGRRWGHINAHTGEFVYQGYMPIRMQMGKAS